MLGGRSISEEFAKGIAQEILASTFEESKSLNQGADLLRFTANLKIAAEKYFAAMAEPGPNDIRRELKVLNSAAMRSVERPDNLTAKPMSKKALKYRQRLAAKFAKVRDLTIALNPTTSQLLKARLCQRAELADSVCSETLLPRGCSEADQVDYCWQIAALSQIGRALEEGRLRPGNRQSRPSGVAQLYAPPPEENPRWRAPERELETNLALAWLELSGMVPVNSEAYRTYVENVFEQLGVKGADVAKLTKECRRSDN